MGILFPFVILTKFSFIAFGLKSLPPQESAWPPSGGPGAGQSGTRVPLLVRCAGNEHDAVFHQGLGTEQFIVAHNINNPHLAYVTDA